MKGHRISSIFAKVIKDRRQELNISLEDFAGKTGVDIKTIVQIENGVDVDILQLWMYENLFNALEINMEDITKAITVDSKKLQIRSRGDELLKEVDDYFNKPKRPVLHLDSNQISNKIKALEKRLGISRY